MRSKIMNRLTLKQLDQTGVVSILSVVIFATIITVVVSSYVATIVAQQQEATSYDRGTRAYYAAESGVQDAIRGLKANPALFANEQTNCNPLTNGSTIGETAGELGDNGGVQYTCQIINTQLGDLKGVVSDTTNAMLTLDPKATGADTYTLQFNWSLNAKDDSDVLQLDGKDTADQLVYPKDKWQTAAGIQVHPMVKLDVISIPKGGFNRANIKQNILFINPVSTSKQASDATSLNFSLASRQDPGEVVSNARCYSNKAVNNFNNYSCQQTITLTGYNFSVQNVYLRLHSIYGRTDFRVALFKGTDQVKLANAQALIDVTGRSGDTYKRVQQTVPIKDGSSTDDWPDAALVAGDGICKLFQAGATPDRFQSNCNPLN